MYHPWPPLLSQVERDQVARNRKGPDREEGKKKKTNSNQGEAGVGVVREGGDAREGEGGEYASVEEQ